MYDNESPSLFSSHKWDMMYTADGVMPADEAVKKYAGIDLNKAKSFAFDSWQQNQTINDINSLVVNSSFLGWAQLSYNQQNAIINNICSLQADTMTAKWITIKSNSDGKQDYIDELYKELDKFDIKSLLNKAIYDSFLLGTSYISVKIKGDEFFTQEKLILSPNTIPVGAVENFSTIEPTWCVPVEFNMINPRLPNFYKPLKYNVMGQVLDKSRCLQIAPINPVNLVSPLYLFGGVPQAQIILPSIMDYQASKEEIIGLLAKMKTSIIKTNLSALGGTSNYAKGLTAAGSLKKRADTYNQYSKNSGIGFINKDEEFLQFTVNLQGLRDIVQQQAEFICLTAQLPVTKVFGQAPQGMNATGEHDERNFNESSSVKQEKLLRSPLDWVIKILQLNRFGAIDDDIYFDFNPLGVIDEEQQSVLKTQEVERLDVLLSKGVITPQQAYEYVISSDLQSMEFADANNSI